MKKIFGTIALAASFAFAGAANAALMDSTFGNTVTVSAGGATVMTYHFEADGTVGLTAGDGTAMAGTWTLDGSNLCVTVGDSESCNDISDHDVGDSWEETDDDGNAMTISITAGH